MHEDHIIEPTEEELNKLTKTLEFNPDTDPSSLKSPVQKAIESITGMLGQVAMDAPGTPAASSLNRLLDQLRSPSLTTEDIDSILKEARVITERSPDTSH